MISIAKLEKGRIHTQIGSVYDLLRNLKEIFIRPLADPRPFGRGHTHYGQFIK